MPLQATSGAASYDGFGGGVAAVPTYIEDIFGTFLYTGNGSTQTITNGIDLAGKGGMVWIKRRVDTPNASNVLTDTARGVQKELYSNSTSAQATNIYGLNSFNADGFGIGNASSYDYAYNEPNKTYASWTFRRQPKFFDVVTWTGDGTFSRNISHLLASVPGAIFIKKTSAAADWRALCKNGTNYEKLYLNLTNATDGGVAISNVATSTTLDVGYLNAVFGDTNTNGATYVAYLFAHNAGGFGLTGTDNVISCGSFTTDGSGNATVNLGYEPQWVLIKRTDGVQNWLLNDVMRGMSLGQTSSNVLFPNLSNAEYTAWSASPVLPNATGFVANGSGSGGLSASANFIYIAIRRGPMKVPTDATKVFAPVARAGTSTATTVTTGFPVDFIMSKGRNPSVGLGENWGEFDRLRGLAVLSSNNTGTEFTSPTYQLGIADFANNTGMNLSASDNDYGYINKSGYNYGTYFLRRAPSFFDEVCYTGTGSAATIPHNLAAVPEFFIVKARNVAGYDWWCYHSALGNTQGIKINTTAAAITDNVWNNTTPTASNFYIANNGYTSQTNKTFVAYLFATCAGVSKVGSYTGTGTTKQVDCGFTSGARFVLIKRTDSTGDWYVWDSARGIVAGNDPYLLLNTTAAEVTSTDYIDTYSAGFEISSTAPAAINASGGTFIFLAIA